MGINMIYTQSTNNKLQISLRFWFIGTKINPR